MTSVRCTWQIYGTRAMAVSIFFAIAFVLLIALGIATTSANEGVRITASMFGSFCALWFCIGAPFYLHGKRMEAKLTRLQENGLRYDAEVVDIKRNLSYIQFGRLISAYAVCRYEDGEGTVHDIKSGSFIFEQLHGKYSAVVYVNPDDREDYAVEVRVAER